MKNPKLFLGVLFLVILFSTMLFAQQDYQIVQNFKSRYSQIEHSIAKADSSAQLDSIQAQVILLKTEFLAHKDLLDKSLYPNDFNSSIIKLINALQLRESDFTQISQLATTVSQLKFQVDTLNSRNTVLLNQLQALQLEGEKNKKTIAMLKRSVASLMVSLHKRDGLVMSMLDSLIPAGIRQKAELTEKEKATVYSKAEKENVISDIKRAINDNIKFLELTNLHPADLRSVSKQERDFESLWSSLGPEITAVYSTRGKSVKNLEEINSSFKSWRKAIVQETWNSINKTFANYSIILGKFSNGKEFTQAATSFINEEISTEGLKGKEEEENTYKLFADSAWFGKVQPVWIPYLIDNKMFSKSQQDTIEARIAQWKGILYPTWMTWVYIIIGLFLIAVVFIIIRRRSSKREKNKPQPDNSNL